MSAPRVFVIAEAGVNHNGSPERAMAMVDAAADAGADAVKFQTFKAAALASAAAPKAEYQRSSSDGGESQRDMLARLELDEEAHRALMARCEERGLEFLSSPFDLEAVALLERLGLRTVKVPSGEITDLPYLRAVGSLKGRVLLSTGMATLDEVRSALDALAEAGTPREDVVVLHCTSEYPTPLDEVNLRAMITMRDDLGVRVGYSDHTQGIMVAVAAVALGAEVIEKHFTLDRALPGPDHKASVEPEQLAALVRAVRGAEEALGSASKTPTPSESRNAPVVRKSIVAARAIAEGETLTADSLAAKRPGTGLSPMLWDSVVGTRAVRDFAPDEEIEL